MWLGPGSPGSPQAQRPIPPADLSLPTPIVSDGCWSHLITLRGAEGNRSFDLAEIWAEKYHGACEMRDSEASLRDRSVTSALTCRCDARARHRWVCARFRTRRQRATRADAGRGAAQAVRSRPEEARSRRSRRRQLRKVEPTRRQLMTSSPSRRRPRRCRRRRPCPRGARCASRSPISRWITRLSGRAPNAGS